MKNTSQLRWRCFWVVLICSIASFANADKKTAKALVTWNSDGKVFQISDTKQLFLGELEGILYIETGEGNMDEGYVSCPVTQEITIKTAKTAAQGYCTIVVGPEDSIFAKWSCNGEVGKCEGKMMFTGGLGKFKKINGSSEILVRSPLQHQTVNLASGSSIKTSSGIIIMKNIEFEL